MSPVAACEWREGAGALLIATGTSEEDWKNGSLGGACWLTTGIAPFGCMVAPVGRPIKSFTWTGGWQADAGGGVLEHSVIATGHSKSSAGDARRSGVAATGPANGLGGVDDTIFVSETFFASFLACQRRRLDV